MPILIAEDGVAVPSFVRKGCAAELYKAEPGLANAIGLRVLSCMEELE